MRAVVLVLLPARAQTGRAGMAMVVARVVESTAHEALRLLEVRAHAQPASAVTGTNVMPTRRIASHGTAV